MSNKFRMRTALDVDDVLLECIPYAIKLANEKYHYNPPLTIHEVNNWGRLGTRADVIFEFFEDPEFFKNQPIIAGAKEFVKKLSKLTEIFISTSIDPRFMGIRAERLLSEFPEIPAGNIFMGSRKEVLNVDILLDDGMHNVFKSQAAFPILMRRPWNQSATGMLAVNTYDEFLNLIEVIKKSYLQEEKTIKDSGIVVLVGPSGSGKSKLAKKLIQSNPKFEKLKSYTTADPTAVYLNDWYNYISKEDFIKLQEQGAFFESTMYAGHGYGSKKEDVDKILKEGKVVIATMDICGAMTLKSHYDNVITIYLKKNRKELLTSILMKKCSDEEKVNRLISIDDERRNEDICDYSVSVTNTDYQDAFNKILEIIDGKKKD